MSNARNYKFNLLLKTPKMPSLKAETLICIKMMVLPPAICFVIKMIFNNFILRSPSIHHR